MMKEFKPVVWLSTALVLAGGTTTYAASIDSTDQYAWSENTGWLNFAATGGNVQVLPDHLEGYVWADNIGWIRLGTHTAGGSHTYANSSATDYGVNRNPATGALSGYAWSENTGWINFGATGGNAMTANDGTFSGYVWGDNIGWVSLAGTATDSTTYKVKSAALVTTPPRTPDPGPSTDWEPLILTSGPFSVAEGTLRVALIDATDPNRDVMTYSLPARDDNALFVIGSATGELSFRSAPDYENPQDADRNNVYTVTVAVSDRTHTVTRTFSVTVTNLTGTADTASGSVGSGTGSTAGTSTGTAGSGGTSSSGGTESTTTFISLAARECAPEQQGITAQYVAFFNRAPDAAGLHYWAVESGLTLEQVGASFFNQPETQLAYPADTSNRDFLTRIYGNLFGRDPDAAGLDYWAGELDNGRIYREQAILAFINGSQGSDRKLLDNKTAVGCYYAAQAPADGNNLAHQVMQGVTAADNSFEYSKRLIDLFR